MKSAPALRADNTVRAAVVRAPGARPGPPVTAAPAATSAAPPAAAAPAENTTKPPVKQNPTKYPG